jgi:hypothetical protein
MTIPTGAPTSPIEVCCVVFGQYPEDILSIVQTVDEALARLNFRNARARPSGLLALAMTN